MSSYYEILGVGENATKDEIKSAFRKKARVCHPDVNKAPDAEEQFKQLGKAYETLMDDDKRALYDRYGEDGLKNAGYSNQGPFDFGFGDLNDILSSFFGGGFSSSQRRANPNAPQQGSDLRTEVLISFEEAAFGVEKEIEITHLEQCPDCNGTGASEGSSLQTCSACGGQGQVQQTTQTILGHFTQITTCPHCKGTGKINTNPCKTCKGDGRIDVNKKLSVKIPAGVDNGSKMRLAAEGDCGKNGGPAGDLYILIYVEQSDYYKRSDVNVYTELPISFSQAALGDEIEIKTLDGNKTIKIPQGIEFGEKIVIKSAGIPYLGKSNRRGDHFVIVKINTPKNLSEEQKKLYRRLYEIENPDNTPSNDNILDKVKGAFTGAKN